MASRTRLHLLAGGLVCSLAFVFSPATRPTPQALSQSGIPASINKPFTRERFTATMHACGPNASYHAYTTPSGEMVLRNAFHPVKKMTAQEAFEAELKKAAKVLEVDRQPTERYKARAVLENGSGVRILYQFDDFLAEIVAPSRALAEEFEAVEENRKN